MFRSYNSDAPRLHPDVQRFWRQLAAYAAPALPLGRRCAHRARLAVGWSRERMRVAETEGQIKGAARRAPRSQSARGFAAAPQGVLRVPRSAWNLQPCWVCRVPFALCCAAVRWGRCHGTR